MMEIGAEAVSAVIAAIGLIGGGGAMHGRAISRIAENEEEIEELRGDNKETLERLARIETKMDMIIEKLHDD